MEKGTHHHRRYNPRHLTLKLLGRNPPRPFRLLHGSCLPELAHRSEIELGPMTLTVGSIFGGRSRARQKRSLEQDNRPV